MVKVNESKQTNRVATYRTEVLMRTTPLTSFASTRKADISLDGGDFNSTTATVAPVSDAGRVFFQTHFGDCAASAVQRKSEGLRFAALAEANGLRVTG